ncbi:MAG: YkgJ family cysteine cluster protein [Myxococcales bacterium]
MRDEDAEPGVSDVVRDRRALLALDAVYRKAGEALAGFGCPASSECCRLRDTGREPYLFPVELLRLRQALARQGRAVPPPRPDGACRLLTADGRRCTVYEDRPFGCRTYFCERVQGPGAFPEPALHRLTARLTQLSDERDPGAHPERLTALLDGLHADQEVAMTSATSPQSRSNSAGPNSDPDRSQPR